MIKLLKLVLFLIPFLFLFNCFRMMKQQIVGDFDPQVVSNSSLLYEIKECIVDLENDELKKNIYESSYNHRENSSELEKILQSCENKEKYKPLNNTKTRISQKEVEGRVSRLPLLDDMRETFCIGGGFTGGGGLLLGIVGASEISECFAANGKHWFSFGSGFGFSWGAIGGVTTIGATASNHSYYIPGPFDITGHSSSDESYAIFLGLTTPKDSSQTKIGGLNIGLLTSGSERAYFKLHITMLPLPRIKEVGVLAYMNSEEDDFRDIEKNWSTYQSPATQEKAKEFCDSKGMKLPTEKNFKQVVKYDSYKDKWKKDSKVLWTKNQGKVYNLEEKTHNNFEIQDIAGFRCVKE